MSLEPQYIRDENGDIKYALVSYQDYQDMSLAKEQLIEAEKIIKAYAQEDDLPHLIDAEIVHKLAEGDNPVRVYREYRGLKAIELARAAGISAAYLSEIETGKKDGTFKTMTAIASILNIGLDDLAPVYGETDQHNHSQSIRAKAIKADTNELTKLIHSNQSFDTAAVRMVAQRIITQIERLDIAHGEQESLTGTLVTARHILHLINEAEKNFIHTAETTRHKLAEALKGYSADTASGRSPAENSLDDIFSKKNSSSNS